MPETPRKSTSKPHRRTHQKLNITLSPEAREAVEVISRHTGIMSYSAIFGRLAIAECRAIKDSQEKSLPTP
jgi:hypothetical protein